MCVHGVPNGVRATGCPHAADCFLIKVVESYCVSCAPVPSVLEVGPGTLCYQYTQNEWVQYAKSNPSLTCGLQGSAGGSASEVKLWQGFEAAETQAS